MGLFLRLLLPLLSRGAALQAVRMCVGGEERGCVTRFSNKEKDHNQQIRGGGSAPSISGCGRIRRRGLYRGDAGKMTSLGWAQYNLTGPIAYKWPID